MAQLLETLKNILSFIMQVISFPIHMLMLLRGVPNFTQGVWWLPLNALAIFAAILVVSVILRVFSK